MRLRILFAVMLMITVQVALAAETAVVDGITWSYYVIDNDTVGIGTGGGSCAIAKTTQGVLIIPDEIKGMIVVEIDGHAFYDCDGLTSITIPDGVTSIGEYAFYDCDGLTSITIPDGVTSFGTCAFAYCSGLTSVTISKGVTSIGEWAFSGCSGLTSVTISEGVTSIGSCAFNGCSRLTSVTIPSSVISIGERAFWYCSGLTSVAIPSCVTRLSQTFPEAYATISNVVMHEGTTSVADSLFANCRGLTSMTIPQSVTSIGRNAFHSCSGLTSVTIPSGVTNIGDDAFSGCNGLTLVAIPSSVTSIGASAFENCSGLTLVEIPSSVTSIGDNAFAGCNGLTSVTISEGVTSIGGSAFSGCSGLTSVTIPKSVTSIGDGAFENCSKLADVHLLSDASKVVIGNDAFFGCHWDLVVHVPEEWKGRSHVVGGIYFERDGSGSGSDIVNLTVTNVIVNYVLNSVQPEIAVPVTSDTGFVNIIAEVKGGVVSVPESWAKNYPNFVSKFGSDFTKALAMKTGKKDGAGNEMLVWQDYVAGTDPTNEKDVFTASITIVDGKVSISYTPELDDARKAMRKYTTWGKTSLMDTDWTEVQDGHEAEYNFFKVSVEMR